MAPSGDKHLPPLTELEIGVVLPVGLVLGGVTTWTIELASRLNSKDVKTHILCHANSAKKDELLCKHDRFILRIPGRPAWHCRLNDINRFAKAYRRSNVNILIPNYSWGAYAAAALTTQNGSHDVRIVGLVHTDSDHYYSLLQYYEPVISKFIVVSTDILAKLHDLLPSRTADLVLLPYPITASTSYQRKSPLSDSLRLVYAGRLEQGQKRILDLKTLVTFLQSSTHHYEITIAGAGGYRQDLEDFIKTHCQELPNITISLIGVVEHTDMPALWRANDICIMFSQYEGASISMVEAMAEGCVPVVTRVSGTSDVVRDGINGFTFPVGDIEFMSSILDSLAGDRQLLSRLSVSCIDFIRDARDPDKYDIQFVNSLLSALESPKRIWPSTKSLAPSDQFSSESLLTDLSNYILRLASFAKRLLKKIVKVLVKPLLNP